MTVLRQCPASVCPASQALTFNENWPNRQNKAVDFDASKSKIRLRCAAAKTTDRMTYENLLQSNQAVVIFILACLVAFVVSRRNGAWGRSRTVRTASQFVEARAAALLARLRFVRGPSRACRGVKFWSELLADLEHANREDALPWEVVLAVTEAAQAESIRPAKLRAVIIHKPDSGLIARASVRLSPRSTPRQQNLSRWSGRRAREMRMSRHLSSTRPRNSGTEVPPSLSPLHFVHKSWQRILSNSQHVRCPTHREAVQARARPY